MKLSLLLGRILFGGYFIVSGLNHFFGMSRLVPYASAHGVPMPQLAVAFSGALIVLGGLSVLLGFRPRIGLTMIILFLVPVTLSMHNFWADADPQQRMMDMTNFMKNSALLGACFGLMAIPVPWASSVAPKRQMVRETDWLTGRRIPH